ncbi:MAG TPA: YihY/virulence factor BrkB family protein [Azonexus sp.]|mgnify:CR=1 FL=1|jgi:YihY family inner membrane protein|nr:YihY/virulence factor BrkB family protein [Azonexus sp.]
MLRPPRSPAIQVLAHPLAFVLAILNNFRAHQGFLLAGAIAYNALLSLVPLLILCVIALSNLVTPSELLETIGRYMEWLVPSQSRAVLDELTRFLEQRAAIGSVLIATMIFFSSLTFSALNQAMAVIFDHRNLADQRSSLLSMLLPFGFVGLLGIGLLAVTLISIGVESLMPDNLDLFGRTWTLHGLSGTLLYLLGLTAETLIIAAIYRFLPVGRIAVRYALVGGLTATALWEIIRHLLVWYFASLSNASVVYGSLTSAVVILFSLEIGATLLLLGAEVIAEYERLGRPTDEVPGQVQS